MIHTFRKKTPCTRPNTSKSTLFSDIAAAVDELKLEALIQVTKLVKNIRRNINLREQKESTVIFVLYEALVIYLRSN